MSFTTEASSPNQSSSKEMCSFRQACDSELSAQTLNNEAAFCIEIGQYDEAHNKLSTAMNQLNILQLSGNYQSCTCQRCNLQACLDHFNNRRPSVEECSEETHFVHRQPILIPHDESMGHCMGVTLQTIICMNLALTYHLSAMEITESELRMTHFRKSFEMYHMVMEELTSGDQPPQVLRLVMAIANNLGEIHRFVGNQGKWVKCMEHLLSTIMLYVYCFQANGNEDTSQSPNKDPLINGLMMNVCSSSVMQQTKAARAA